MTVLESTDIPARAARISAAAERPKVAVDLTAAQILRYDDLLDRIFDFTFDVLGISNLELRVRESAPGRRVS